MNAPLPAEVLKQHLIDPEICIRCNTCEETCPIKAITHDSNNYVEDPDICNGCMACVPPCPTGAIDNWRLMVRAPVPSGETTVRPVVLRNAMDRPSGHHCGRESGTTFPSAMICISPPGRAFARLQRPFRPATNAIHSPSGDQVGAS